MTDDPSLMQMGTRHSLLHKLTTSRFFTPLSGPIFLTLEEVVERYRGRVSEGTLRKESPARGETKRARRA
jgi:hypothetical protein